jgi:secondary thiamine-phosphate synthase enzyme
MPVLEIETSQGTNIHNITDRVFEIVSESGVVSGLCNLFVPHSTAAITINAAIDNEVPLDLVSELNRLVPMRVDFVHQFDSPGDAAGHIKTSLVGPSVTIPVAESRLGLSSSQSILFCEFDGPRNRRILVNLLGEKE